MSLAAEGRGDFLPKHLGRRLEEVLDEEIFEDVRKAILTYDEMLADAQAEVDRRIAESLEGGSDSPPDIATCPSCDHELLLIETERGEFCFFCREEFSMAQHRTANAA